MAFVIPYAIAAVAAANVYQQGQANANAADYNAKVADTNKGLALIDQNRQSQQAFGRMRASYGASGVQVGTGSPMDVLADSAGQSELDKLKIRYNYDSRSTLDRSQAENYRTSSVLNAFGSGLKAYGSAIPMFGGGGQNG